MSSHTEGAVIEHYEATNHNGRTVHFAVSLTDDRRTEFQRVLGQTLNSRAFVGDQGFGVQMQEEPDAAMFRDVLQSSGVAFSEVVGTTAGSRADYLRTPVIAQTNEDIFAT